MDPGTLLTLVLVASLCSLPVGVLRWRGPTPRLTVIVKATYTIARDGAAELANAQLPLSLDVPDPHGSPGALWYASDFVPRKALADVTLVGGAFADPPSALIPVQLLVSGLERKLVARAGAPSPYIPLSESYLHASLARNAATVAVGPRSVAARALGDAAGSLDGAGLPAGLLDEGFDYAAFNAAPREQQIRALRTDATITLVGATRDGERRTVSLPGHRPRAFHAGAGGPGATPNEIALTADTLWIDSYGEVCVLVWRGEITRSTLAEAPREILVALEQGPASWGWPELGAAFASARRDRAIEPADLGAIVDDDPGEAWDAAPDRGGDHIVDDVDLVDDEIVDVDDDDVDDDASPTGRPPPIEVDEEGPATPKVAAAPANESTGLLDLAMLQRKSTLPFAGASRRAQPAPPAEDRTGMIDLAQLRASPTLPFARRDAAIAAAESEDRRPPQNLSALPFDRPRRRNDPLIQTASTEEHARAARPATPFERFAPPPRSDDATPRAVRTDALPFARPPVAIAPPIAAALPFAPEPRFTPTPLITSPAPLEAAPAPTKATAPETPLLALETYAAIKAELWRRSPLALPAVVAEHGLTEVEWLTHDLRYVEAIDAQAREGTSAIAASVARAMAAAKRARSGGDDLDLGEYLALKSEIEAAGDVTLALKKRGLTRRALRRIERRWQPRTAV